jgi:hypothetical protein
VTSLEQEHHPAAESAVAAKARGQIEVTLLAEEVNSGIGSGVGHLHSLDPNCCNEARAYILKPDGSTLELGTQVDNSPYGGVYFYNNSVIDTVALPVTGT